jgi:transposase
VPEGRKNDRIAANEEIPLTARKMIAQLGSQIADLNQQIKERETELKEAHKANPVSRLLAEIPGIGPITALTLATQVSPQHFKSAHPTAVGRRGDGGHSTRQARQ